MKRSIALSKKLNLRKGFRATRNRRSFNEVFVMKILMAFSLGVFFIGLLLFIEQFKLVVGQLYPAGNISQLKNIDIVVGQMTHADVIKKRSLIKGAMQHAWSGYRKYAFGYDELRPVIGLGVRNWFGVGTTLVDSLDTLWLMGMKEEFYEARDWVRDSLSHDVDHLVSTFENTIRSLGGLLSAYYWSKDEVFKEKAEDIGMRLIRAFDSPSGIPYFQVNLKTGEAANEDWSKRETQISAAGSLQLEFRELARITNNKTYSEKPDHALDVMYAMKPENGLYPTAIRNLQSEPSFGRVGSRITFGGRADSFYEYMLKLWLQSGKTETKYRDAYDEAIEGMHNLLLRYSSPNKLAYLVKIAGRRIIHEFEHLECFMGGLLALGAHTDPLGVDSERAKRDMKTAKDLTYTCYQMYATTETGLAPEIAYKFKSRTVTRKGATKTLRKVKETLRKEKDFEPKGDAAHYLLRPEVVESLFILNKITGDSIYREWGWEIFVAIEKFCKTKYGYGAFPDVRDNTRTPNDSMESFFLGETMKYLYLLFDPDTEIDLEKHVFNTEAHPLPTGIFMTGEN